MENLFNEKESFEFAAKYPDAPRELSLRVYTTRLLGGNSRLVLHGGGNTSVKLKIPGEESDVIFVKASGWNMANIEPEGFTGLYLQPLRELRRLDDLSASEMEHQVKVCQVSADAPPPSVEALLHAFIPHRYVEHTHSDSILIITNQKHGQNMIKEAMGEKIAVLPYIASGFPLAKAAADAFDRNPDIDGIVIMNHGIFTFAEDVRTSYNKMMAYVNRAEAYIEQQIKGKNLLKRRGDLQTPANAAAALARCVRMIRDACGNAVTSKNDSPPFVKGGRGDFSAAKIPLGPPLQKGEIYTEIRNDADIIEISLSEPAREICRSGMLTPHHAILAKHAMAYIASVPEDDESLRAVIHREIANFKSDYDRLFYESSPEGRGASGLYSRAARGNEENAKKRSQNSLYFCTPDHAARGNEENAKKRSQNSLYFCTPNHAERGNETADVYPSLFFIAGLGLVAVGATPKAACIAADIGEHNIRAKIRAFALGEYQAVSDTHVFDIYRSLSKK